MTNVKFKSGEVAAVPQSIDNGTLFATTDSKELYIDIEDQRIALPNKDTVNTAISGKQDALVSGTNIKTINNNSILGSGNIDIQAGIQYDEIPSWDTNPSSLEELQAAGFTMEVHS